MFNGNRDAEEKRNVLEEKGSLRVKSYQLLYPGVPGTAPLAAAAASLCFLFTRKLWKSQGFISHFTLFVAVIQKNMDDETNLKLDLYIYFYIFFYYIIIWHFANLSLSAMKIIYTREWDYSRYEVRGLRPPTRIYLKSLLHLRRSDRAVIVFVLLPQRFEPLLLSPLLLQLFLLLPKLWQKERETKKRKR